MSKFYSVPMKTEDTKRFKIKGAAPLLFVAVLGWVVVVSSCANIGMPSGGPKDSIPPVVVETMPEYKAVNYKGKDVRFTFNEFISSDKISETLVISPPLKKNPIIRTKSKTLIIRFDQELKDSTTYSLDFKNSVVDNNEGNPLKNFRFLFSTGPVLDSLRVAGQVVNGFNLEPLEGMLVGLQSDLHDSAVYNKIPDYIAETDELGRFLMDNVAPGKYHIFAVNDVNADKKYAEGAEEIAFWDEIIVPRATFHPTQDTVVKGLDSMVIVGHTHFYPDPLYMNYFMEDVFEQYLESAERESRYKCEFIFSESVKDSFNVRLLEHDVADWNIMEPSENVDSIVMWIADTTLARYDSLSMELSYIQLDSAGNPYLKADTVQMNFADRKVETKKKQRKHEEENTPKPVPQFSWSSNVSGTKELYGNFRLTAPEPVAHFDSSMITLFLSDDTLQTPLDFKFRKNPNAYRTYDIIYAWEPATKYTLTVDSAACVTIYGNSSRALWQNFETREEDYYGSLTFEFSNVEMPMLVQLLENSDDEKVIREAAFSKDGPVEFAMVPPDKYRVKIIYDANGNGEWDAGSFTEKIQPERVSYNNEVIKLRSNWSQNHRWDVTLNPTFQKDIIDKEEQAKKRKEAAEKRRKEQKSQEKTSPFKSGDDE